MSQQAQIERYFIARLSAPEIRELQPELIALLQNAVASNSSLGFWPPLSEEEARAYWEEVTTGAAEGTRIVLAVREPESGRVIGSVQLAFTPKPNARLRAEVQKLCVHTDFRNRGLGRALMAAIEDEARAVGRSLLVLDTRRGDIAEGLYGRIGYTRAGEIPGYTVRADGSRHATVIFYKELF